MIFPEKKEFKTLGFYEPQTDTTHIYVCWRDENGTLFARTPNHKKVECCDGCEMPEYTWVPGKVEVV